MPITRNHIVTYGFYIPHRILGICPIFAILFIITSIRTTPRPLVLDYPQQEIVIQDQLNVIHNEQLYNEFVKFQKTTGITPAFESISHSTEGDSLENYAVESYERTFKDEKHCLFVYSEDENQGQLVLITGKATKRILDDYALACYDEHIENFLSYNDSVDIALVDTFKILNSQVMYSGVVKEDSFKFGLVCIFLTIAAILGLVREFSVMKKEKFCKIPDHIEIGPTVKCPYCKGKMIKGMHISCPHCESELYNIY